LSKVVKEGFLPDQLSTRDQLVATAAKLFAQQGYNKTNMRDLADVVGMKAGSIFYHFKGKEAILYEVMKSSITLLVEPVKVKLKATNDPEAQLRILVKAELEHYLGDTSDFAMVLIHEWRSLSKELQAPLMTMRSEYEVCWNEVLVACQQAGLIRANPKIVRRMLNGAFSWVTNWFHEDGGYGHEELIDEIMLMLINK
jgi:AcrR family transcriptional regulator